MKRRVKTFYRKKGGKTYEYHWIGYQTRNENGTSYFEREVNISSLPDYEIERIDKALRANNNETICRKLVKFSSSIDIGSHWAILRICENSGIYNELLDKLSTAHSTAILAMIVDRVANPNPYSKLMLSKAHPKSGLARILTTGKVPFNDWYSSLDALYEKQSVIEKSLMPKADDNTIFMYDITSIYFEGDCCPLTKFGYNRDGKKGKKQIVVGMLTDSSGRPLGVRVFEGNTKDASTVLEQMSDVKTEFGVDEFIFVGDRGMVTGTIRDELLTLPESGIDYITALTRGEIMKLANDEHHPLQASLFDKEIAEVRHNGIRYALCYNPLKCDEDKKTRLNLLAKTEDKLKNIEKNVRHGRYKNEKVIAKRLYTWLNHWGVGKCFEIDYGDEKFKYKLNQDKIDELERLDGCYVITTTVKADVMDKNEIVSRYKSLIWVEQIFRHMKTTDEFTRPVRHWNAERVKGHVFMCMLAYLVIWTARNAFAEFLERDETCMCEGGSLREIWEELDRGITIGTLSFGGEKEDQLSPIPNYQKRLLKAAKASINKKEKERLRVV